MVQWPSIWANFKRLPAFAKEEFGEIAFWIALVAPTISAIVGAIFSPWTAAFLLVIYYMGVGLFALLSKYAKLEEKQKARMELLWGEGHPYLHEGGYLGLDTKVLWRFGIKNLSNVKSLENVNVKLERLDPPFNKLIPAPLRYMLDHPADGSSYKLHIDINPTGEQSVEFVGQLLDGRLFFCYANKFVSIFEMPETRQCIATVKATAKDAAPRLRDFKLSLNGNNNLILEPYGNPYSEDS